MHPTAVINVVGLTEALLGEDTPHLNLFRKDGVSVPLDTVTPALTCTVQSTFLTGLMPSGHGAVANGWYFRELAEVGFWKQSNALVHGEKVWESARRRDESFTCAQMFWWYNMYSGADFSVTPRPIYPADGRKVLDTYSHPGTLNQRLKSELGDFPFFSFWGPRADIRSSEWIAEASLKVIEWEQPTLSLIYLPHLDYNLQRLGPDDPEIRKDLVEIDNVCGKLIDRLRSMGRRVVVLSEYGITSVTGPIHINRILREAGHVQIRSELGLEMLAPGASEAFAVADHQIAHIYVRDPARTSEIRSLLESTHGIEAVLGPEGKAEIGLDHPRSGDLVAISKADRWFSYYYWLDDRLAPDFSRTVDIHRKPGYDPVELFVDPTLTFPALKVAGILLKKKLGFRYLMDVIPLDAGLVKGSHGRPTDDVREGPLFMTSEEHLLPNKQVHATDVKNLILSHIFDS